MPDNGPYSIIGPQPRRGKPKPMGGDHAKKGCAFAALGLLAAPAMAFIAVAYGASRAAGWL